MPHDQLPLRRPGRLAPPTLQLIDTSRIGNPLNTSRISGMSFTLTAALLFMLAIASAIRAYWSRPNSTPQPSVPQYGGST